MDETVVPKYTPNLNGGSGGVSTPNPSTPSQGQSQPQTPQLEDGPPRIEYVVARHVAILDEHEMTSGPSGVPMYCGPQELQQIADNNNRRVESTGDATPIVIGHTVDGKDENRQPEIVGYATNFSVGPLFNSGRTALFADFHIRKDKVEEANKYPRRSVELWPKRWEIDPISLLGATTPERDLGLLQLHRQGSPVRYSRMSPKSKIRYSHDEPHVIEIDAGDYGRGYHNPDARGPDGEEFQQVPRKHAKVYPSSKAAQQELDRMKSDYGVSEEELGARIVPASQAPAFPEEKHHILNDYEPEYENEADTPHIVTNKHKLSRRGLQRNSRSQNMADVPGKDGSGAPDEGTAKIVAAVLESAPIKQMLEQQQELMMMLQGGGAPEHGEPDGDEGGAPPMPPQAQGGEPQPGDQGEPHDQDAAWIHEGAPERYEEDEDGYFDPSCGSMGKKKYSGGFASSTDGYIPTTGPSRMSRRTQYTPTYQEYLDQLAQSDRAVKMSRENNRLASAEKRIRELEQDKVRYSRGEKLRALQAEGLDLDVADEIKHIEELGMTEEQFNKYVERIKVKYQRDPSRVEMIRVQDSGKGVTVDPMASMNHEQKIHYSRKLADKILYHRNNGVSEQEAMVKAKAELAQEHVR